MLDLSRGMAYKNALAGLDLGGGKAVIWGDPEQIKSEALLRAYGRFVESLGGRYYTACDVGTYVRGHGRDRPGDPLRDRPQRRARRRRRLLDPHRLGRLPGHAGRRRARLGHPERSPAGGSAWPAWARSASTSPGTCWTTAPRWWRPTSTRRRWSGCATTHPQVTLVDDAAALVAADIDVYAPCALGGALNDDTVPVLRAKVVAGAANNQLAHPGIEKLLADRGILYAPDYVVNAGGVIQVADEIEGFNFERAKLRATRIYDTTRRDPPARRRRGRAAGGGRGPAGRAADGRGRPAAHDPPAVSVPGGGPTVRLRAMGRTAAALSWKSGFVPV